jgi:hypothetical protein
MRNGILHGARVMSCIARRDSPLRYLGVLLVDHGVVIDV